MQSPWSQIAPEFVKFSEHPRWNQEGVLSLRPEHGPLLAAWWERILSGHDVWVTLPLIAGQEWRLLFKQKEGDNRILLAHPDANSWVMTVALTTPTHQEIIETLKGSQDVSIERIASRHAPLSRVSNAHLRFEFQPQ